MKGDLVSFIRGKNLKKFSEDEVIIFLIQIIKAIDLLRCNYGIQHRDLKPQNILVYKDNWYLLSDFGSSR
jgi:serine/threonine protein kinase